MKRDSYESKPVMTRDSYESKPVPLDDREEAVARRAAKIAVAELTNDFYKAVGKTVVSRVLIFIGLIVVGFASAKGWIKFGL